MAVAQVSVLACEPSVFLKSEPVLAERANSARRTVNFVLRRVIAAAIAVFVTACGPAYGGGMLLTVAEPSVVSVELECVDVQVERLPVDRVTFVYRIGNRCLRPVRVDLAAVRVRGAVGFDLVDLEVSDPRRELRHGTLDGGSVLEEHLSYDGPDRVGRVCLTFEGIADGATSEPLCMEEST